MTIGQPRAGSIRAGSGITYTGTIINEPNIMNSERRPTKSTSKPNNGVKIIAASMSMLFNCPPDARAWPPRGTR